MSLHGPRRGAASALLAVAVLLGAAAATLSRPQAAEAVTCSSAAVTMSPLHSPDGTTRPFYADFSHASTNHSGYVGYELTGASLGSDVWIKLSGFSSAIRLATNQSATIPARALSQGGHPVVYAYLTATAATTTAQSFNVEVWNGKPNQVGSTQVCVGSDGFSSVEDIINANANKITSISISNSSPAVGGSFDVTAVGDTGSMGAGPASDQSGGNGVISMAPAMDDSWPADAFSLTGTAITIGGTTTRDKLRIYPGGSGGAYTAKYYFSVRNTTSSATTVLPVQSIASGTQVKYTGSYPGTISQISATSVTTSLVKSVNSMSGPPYHVTYQVVVSNTSTSSVVLDYLLDTPTPNGALNWTFDSGSARRDGTALPDPTYDASAGTLLFAGPFTVPGKVGTVDGTLTFTYSLAVNTTVSNSVVGTVGAITLGAASGSSNQVAVDPTSPVVTTSSLPNATASSSYSQTLVASGGTPPYTWSVSSGSLPAGLSLNSSTGAISGTPAAAGSATFTVTATDALSHTGSKSLTLTVDAAAPAPGDTTRPTGSLSVNGGATTTNNATVSVALTSSDDTGVVAYRVAQSADCSSASWVAVTATASLATTAPLTLTGGDGAKTICAEYKDAAGNVSTTATTSITLDTARPTVTLASGAPNPTNGSFTVTATFSESVSGFAAGDIVLGNATLSGFTGSGSSYSFDVTPVADGSVTVDVADAAAADAAGNTSTAAAQLTRTIDSARPSVTLTSAAPGTVTGAFTVTATFSESVTGFAASDLTVGNGSVSALSGTGASYSFTVTPAADGAVSVDVPAGGAADAAGNTNTAAAQLTRTADVTAPSLMLTTSAADPTNAAFTVTATFSENVTGLAVGDVVVGNGTASAFSGSGAGYSFTVTPAADGTVTVDVGAGAALDAAGNPNAAAVQLTRTVDSTRPALALTTAATAPVGGAFTVTATFSESVGGFAAGDVAIGNGTISGFAGAGDTYTFTVTPTGDGTVTVDVAAGAAADAAGNGNTAAPQLARAADLTRPSLSLSAPAGPVNGPFVVTATFSENVTGFAAGDVTVSNATLSGFAGSGTSYSFTVTPSADGVVTIDVAAGAAADAAGNASLAASQLSRTADTARPTLSLTAPAGPVNGAFTVTATFSEAVTGFTAGDIDVTNGTVSGLAGSGTAWTFIVTPAADGAVTVDAVANVAADAAGNGNTAATQLTRTADLTRPTVSLSAPAGPLNGPFVVTATFSEGVSGFDASDLHIANGAASAVAGSGAVYTFTVTATADGSVDIDIAANAATDSAGNQSIAAATLTRSVDTAAPALALTAPAGPFKGAFTVTATFNKSVNGFAAADVTAANGILSNFAGTGSTYTFTVTPVGDGAVTVDVAAGAATDDAGNSSAAATQLMRTADLTRPSVTLTTSAPNPTSGTFTVTATFSEAVTGFATTDVTATRARVSALAGSGQRYTFTVSPTSDGPVTVDVGPDGATDAAGNGNLTSNRLSVTNDETAPVISFGTHPSATTVDTSATIVFTADETVTYECALDGAAFAPCTSPLALEKLSVETHALVVRARDTAGNVSEKTLSWKVVRPAVDFTSEPVVVSDDTVTIAWSGNDPNLLYTCTLDAQPPAPCSAPFTVANLPDGEHTFTVVAALPDGAVKGTVTRSWTSHRTLPRPEVVIIPKITPTDLLGRPQLFKQSADAPHSNGPFTRKIEVKLSVPTPESVETVYISNYADFRDVQQFARAADNQYDWTLLAGPSGDRVVYIRFSNDADAPVGEATIVLDQELPALTPRSYRTMSAARTTQAASGRTIYCGAAPRRWMRVPAVDGFSGLNAMQIASDPKHPCAWRPYLSTVSYRLPGKVVWVRIEDRVGNIGPWVRVRRA